MCNILPRCQVLNLRAEWLFGGTATGWVSRDPKNVSNGKSKARGWTEAALQEQEWCGQLSRSQQRTLAASM